MQVLIHVRMGPGIRLSKLPHNAHATGLFVERCDGGEGRVQKGLCAWAKAFWLYPWRSREPLGSGTTGWPFKKLFFSAGEEARGSNPDWRPLSELLERFSDNDWGGHDDAGTSGYTHTHSIENCKSMCTETPFKCLLSEVLLVTPQGIFMSSFSLM